MLAIGSGGNGSGFSRTICSRLRAVGAPSSRSRHIGGESGRSDTEAGEPVDVGEPAPVRGAPCAQNRVLVVSMAPAHR